MDAVTSQALTGLSHQIPPYDVSLVKKFEKAIQWTLTIEQDMSPKWKRDVVLVSIEKSPLAKNAKAQIFKMRETSMPDANFVVKFINNYARITYLTQLLMHSLATTLAASFNSASPTPSTPVKFTPSLSVLELVERPAQALSVCLCEPLLEGDYSEPETALDTVRPEFNHWVVEKSNGEIMLNDFAPVNNTDFLSSPQVHTKSGKGYGESKNSGAQGILHYVESHKCNAQCRALKLTPFADTKIAAILSATPAPAPAPAPVSTSTPSSTSSGPSVVTVTTASAPGSVKGRYVVANGAATVPMPTTNMSKIPTVKVVSTSKPAAKTSSTTSTTTKAGAASSAPGSIPRSSSPPPLASSASSSTASLIATPTKEDGVTKLARQGTPAPASFKKTVTTVSSASSSAAATSKPSHAGSPVLTLPASPMTPPAHPKISLQGPASTTTSSSKSSTTSIASSASSTSTPSKAPKSTPAQEPTDTKQVPIPVMTVEEAEQFLQELESEAERTLAESGGTPFTFDSGGPASSSSDLDEFEYVWAKTSRADHAGEERLEPKRVLKPVNLPPSASTKSILRPSASPASSKKNVRWSEVLTAELVPSEPLYDGDEYYDDDDEDDGEWEAYEEYEEEDVRYTEA